MDEGEGAVIDLRLGDCLEVLATLPDNSVDAIVCDPPYELSFMAKRWDGTGIAFSVETWQAVLRVAKPGAYLVAFGGTRTHHRMMVAIEDAGFEIRDCLQWIFGSGFPKSHNIGDGRGTALKPAYEPIVLARKPLEGTTAANVAMWGCGALNIDACRIAGAYTWRASDSTSFDNSSFGSGSFGDGPNALGRWPANIILDEAAATELDRQSGQLTSGGYPPAGGLRSQVATYGTPNERGEQRFGSSTGGASRFFYVAKASRADREDGLQHFDVAKVNDGRTTPIDNAYQRGETERKNTHPTVKPTELMRYLVRLVTPPGGQVLDCFMGSGSTGVAAIFEGFRFVGIEREVEYMAIAQSRIEAAAAKPVQHTLLEAL